MPTDVVMPQMGESITEGTLTKWLKKPGDTVARDEPLFEISTDKVDAEIPSPSAGTLGAIKVEEGATVTVGTVVCAIDEAGSAAPCPPTPRPKQRPSRPQPLPPRQWTHPSRHPRLKYPVPGTEVPMPQMGESITEGTLTKWLKRIGDAVARDEPIFEISTDKVDAEIPSPIAGTLTAIRVQEGETVGVGSIVAIIGGAPGAAKSATPAAPQSASPHTKELAEVPSLSTPAPAVSASAGEAPRSSPLVRKIASENNVDLTTVPGTGASGRITKQDILGHLEGGTLAAAPVAATTPPTPSVPAPAKQTPAAPVSAPTPRRACPAQQDAQHYCQAHG